MATGLVGFVGPIVGKIGEYLMAPVGRHFGYLFSYKSKVKNLEDEVKKLDEKRGAMQLSVDEAERNVKVIGPDVKGWLERVDKCSEEAREILKDEVEANKGCPYGWCPNLLLRYSLGKKATNKAKEVAKLHEERKLTQVAYNEPPPGIESTSIEGIKVFESRRLIMNDVMEALKDDRFHMIAICGMGGVGKTTMVNEVAKRAKEEKLFDEVVMAVVSQSPNERKIQGEIGDKLGLEFKEETERGRADRLRERLRVTTRILVILDDVWKHLELNDIGIPFGDGHEGCKILLTSRFDNVCNDMNAQKKFTVEVLTEEEAWNLFEEMAGISNDTSHTSTDLYITQKKVADECGCLPIAIATVARALKDKDKHSWNSALLQLRKSMVKNIREVEEKVFKSLELSYDFLGSREIKECFLLCSLYAEDFNIPIEDLVRYGVGIELFEAIDSVDEARDRVHAFVDDLKKGYLLMDGEREGCVKMHDVVRDVAISIASREEHSFMVRCDQALKEWPKKERHKNYAVISLRCTGMSELPDNLEFPKLHLLRLEDGYASKLLNLPDSFYGGMKELKALSMLNVYKKGSLPTSLRWLTNLRSLSLYECRLINDVSAIGALENLEILSFEGTKIVELPKEIGRLSHLKLLDLLRCGVQRICPGVLSSLSKLEELYLGSSFNDVNRIEETKATFTELCGLSNFTTLVIYLERFAYWPRDLVLTNLKAFAITTGIRTRYLFERTIGTRDCRDYQLQNQLSLEDLHKSDLMESGFKNLFKITKILGITRAIGVKNVGYDLDKDGFKKLTELLLKDCQDLEYVICTTDGVSVPQIAFPVLQWLRLDNLDKLKKICCGQLPEEAFSELKRLELRNLPALTHLWKGPTQLVQLRNLTSLKLKRCDKLKSMLSLSIARDLMQLQRLDVSKCRKMEVLISSEEGDENEMASTTTETTDKIEFPKLKRLYLKRLPSFTAICKAMNGIELLQLNELTLSLMPKLNSFCNTSDSNYDTIQPLFNKMAFSSLKRLEVQYLPALTHLWKGPTQLVRLRNLTSLILSNCDELESMFSLSIARDLMQLQELDVFECRKMELLISSEVGDQNEIASTTTETTDKIGFPKLKELYLRELPSFTAICKAMNGIELQQLNRLKLCGIPKLNSFCNTPDSNYNTIQPLFNKGPTQLVRLRNLTSLILNNCDELESMFSLSIARDLMQLQELSVYECHKMEVLILSEEEGDQNEIASTTMETTDKIVFPKLKELCLGVLSSFTAICKAMNGIELLQLNQLKLWQIPKLNSFCNTSDDNYDTIQPLFSKVAFSMSKRLELRDLPAVTHLWKGPTQLIRLCNLTSLILSNCEELKSMFSLPIARDLMQLEMLDVSKCRKMEVLISIEGGDQNEIASTTTETIDKIEFPKLKRLYLRRLPSFTAIYKALNGIELLQLNELILSQMPKLNSFCNTSDSNYDTIQPLFNKVAFSALTSLELLDLPALTHLWKDPTQLVWLRNLTSLELKRCDKLESMFSLSIARDLMQLQILNVSECRKMEVLISSEEEGDQIEIASTTTNEILFPKLKELYLGGLPNFTAICKAMNGIELPQLNQLKPLGIPKLNSFCNTSESNYDTIQPLFNKGPTQLVRLYNLTSLKLTKCDKLESMFSLSIAKHLMELQNLDVSVCRKMEVLISSEEQGDQNEIASITTETTDKIVFPKLKRLYLRRLPSFTAICKAMNTIELLQLNELVLSEIPKLNSFCNTSDGNYDTIQPLFNQVKLITIEKLVILGMDNVIEIWPRELQPKVKDMIIWHCRKLLNILKGMQSIERLMVAWCQSLEVAFDFEGIIVREGYPDIVLPSLTKLGLHYLPKLTHVWKNNLPRIPSFQNLTSLTVVGCGSLRYIFSSSQAKLLVKLQEITITECGVLEAIVNEEPKVDDEVATNIIMFPQLNSLKLCHLPNLKSLCPQAYTFEGSFFKKIEVINCPNIRALPSALQQLLELQESNVRQVEFFNSAQHHLLDRKFSLSTKGILDVTGIDEPTEIWHNQLEVGCLDKVRFMRIQCCGKLSSVVSSKLMQRLHNIQGLRVWWCDSLEMIFDLQEGVCADVAEKQTLITQLSELILKYLPKLTHIWKNISQQTHCFENLSSLRVQHCDNLRYIFTISMANVLVNLLNLTVEDCEKVEKIVTRENEEEIFWLKIRDVNLRNLPSLVCFGPDVNDIEIPAIMAKARFCPKFPGEDNEDYFEYLDIDYGIDDLVEEDDDDDIDDLVKEYDDDDIDDLVKENDFDDDDN